MPANRIAERRAFFSQRRFTMVKRSLTFAIAFATCLTLVADVALGQTASEIKRRKLEELRREFDQPTSTTSVDIETKRRKLEELRRGLKPIQTETEVAKFDPAASEAKRRKLEELRTGLVAPTKKPAREVLKPIKDVATTDPNAADAKRRKLEELRKGIVAQNRKPNNGASISGSRVTSTTQQGSKPITQGSTSSQGSTNSLGSQSGTQIVHHDHHNSNNHWPNSNNHWPNNNNHWPNNNHWNGLESIGQGIGGIIQGAQQGGANGGAQITNGILDIIGGALGQ